MTYNTGSILYVKVFTIDQFSSKVKVEVSFELNTYNAMGKFRRWQIDDTFLIFPRKAKSYFQILSQSAFFVNLYRAVIGPSG